MMRGNYRQNIFSDDTERQKFLEYLGQANKQYDCKIHLFCLMTNHVHLVIQISKIPLSKIMQTLNSAFTGFVNRKHQKSGHLFQGRYLAKLVQDESYLKELCYYIHNNPVAANMYRILMSIHGAAIILI